MKTRLLQIIVSDKARAIPLGVAIGTFGAIALAKAVGFDMSLEMQATFSAGLGIVLGWILDAWALNNVTDGVKKMQSDLKIVAPSIEVDGVPLAQSQHIVKEGVKEIASQGVIIDSPSSL